MMTPLQIAELMNNIGEIAAAFTRMGQIVIETEAPAPEPEAVEEFPEIEGVIYV